MRYLSPVGIWEERLNNPPFAKWWDATGFGKNTAPAYVTSQNAYHTGADLNLDSQDAGKPVYASANGYVVFTGAVAGWQGLMVVIKHIDGIWTRYAHLRNLTVQVGTNCTAQTKLGEITDYTPLNSPSGDHVHFDVSVIDLGAHPADWPKMDLARLERDYRDPKQWITDHWNGDISDMTYWQSTDDTNGTRVRLTQDLAANNVIGVIPPFKTVEGELTTDSKWLKVKVKAPQASVSGITLLPSKYDTFDGFAAAQFMRPVSQPVPPPVKGMRLGLHLLNPASEQSGREGEEAFARGCRVFTVIDDEQFAIKLARMGARVFFRWWIGNTPIKPSDLAGRVSGFCKEPNIVILGLNEGDVTGCFTASNMDARGAWDNEAFNLIKAQGGTYAGYGCAMGNPEVLDQNVLNVLKKWYAPLWSKGMLINYHSYSETFDKPFQSYDWYEGRWRWLFTHCGLNPANPAHSEIIGDETGVDVMGHGGFASFNATDEQVQNWCRMHYKYQAQALVVGGISYPSPYTDATIFQCSNSRSWAGYKVNTTAVVWHN